jgi:hypothetical protein
MRLQGITLLCLLFGCFTFNLSYSQIYLHNFGSTTISTHPYTVAPGTLDANLNSSSWSNSTGSWTSFGGSAGQAIALNNSAGTPTITLTFDVASGYEASFTSFNFWRQRSANGAANWSMTINGIAVGSGTALIAGASLGTTAVTNAVNNQTGTITVVLSLSGASGTGTFRIDDFTLNGSVTSACTPPATPTAPTAAANPSCGATTLAVLSPAAGEIWYWQGTNSSGTNTANPTSSTYPVAASGTYYVRAFNSSTSCWSAVSASIAMTIYSSPAISAQPANASASSGSNASFSVTASGAGLSYEWQENQGSGFANIIDGGIYSGATTATLTLSGVPLSMDSWQYQCIVTGTCTPAVTTSTAALAVVTTSVGDYRSIANGNWATNTTWEKWNGSAWVACSSGDFPDAGTANVEIRTHTVDLDGAGSPPFDCKNLTVQTGGLLWTGQFGFSNDYIQIYGNITCNGTIGVSTGDDICFDIAGGNNCTISGTGSLYATRIRKDANINPASNASLTIDMNIFLFWSTGSGTIMYNDGKGLFNVTVNAGKTLKGITAGAVSNNISMDGLSGADFDSTCTGSYTVYGTIEVDGTVYSTTNNTLASYAVSITIKNGGVIKCAYVTASASGAATSTLTIESGGKLTLTGADASSNAFASFSTTNNIYALQTGSTVEYAGTAAQNVESQLTYSNITFSGGGLKTLNGATTVNAIATFSNGLVTSTSTNLLNMSAGSSATGANNASFVTGPVSKNGSSDFIFPVGKDLQYRPISVTTLSGPETFTAEYFHADPDAVPYDVTLKDATLDDIGRCEYWMLNRSGVANAVVSLSWDSYSCGVTSLSDLAVARWDGSMWKDEGNTATTGSPDPGTGTVSSGLITSFSPFTLSSKAAGVNPLPIELLFFSASYNNNNQVELKWSTATEINNDYYTTERSMDAIHYSELGTLDGGGNSIMVLNYFMSDKAPYSGVSYYRLKQTDFDGSYRYSEVVSVEKESNDFTIISANYSMAENSIVVYLACGAECLVSAELFDLTGRKIYTCNKRSSTELFIPAQNLSKGMYLLKVSDGKNLISKKINL